MPDEITPGFPPPGTTAVMVFNDPTPNTVILNRIVRNSIHIAQHTDLERQEGSDAIDVVLVLARKLLSVWRHLQAYKAEEERLRAAFAASAKPHPEHSQELYEEFDVFSVQVKSTLDYLVGIMRPVIGPAWTIYAFGDKGQRVLNALKRNTGKRYAGHVQNMEKVLFNQPNLEWLGMIIEVRDRINHGIAGGMRFDRFAVFKKDDGTVSLPTWNAEQTLSDAMTVVWENLFRYVEDFIALALSFRLKDGLALHRRHVSPNSATVSWTVARLGSIEEFLQRRS
jgi:hypothetical protein